MTCTEADLCPSKPRTGNLCFALCVEDFFPQQCWAKELLDGNSAHSKLLLSCFSCFTSPGKQCEGASRSYQSPVLTKIHRIKKPATLQMSTLHTHTRMISKLQRGWFYCQSNSQRLFWETTFLFGLTGAVGLWNKCLSHLIQVTFTGLLSPETRENFTLWFEIYCHCPLVHSRLAGRWKNDGPPKLN